MDRYTRIATTKLLENRCQRPRDEGLIAADGDFAGRKIGEEFDVLGPLSKFIEDRNSAREKGAAVFGRLHPLAAAMSGRTPSACSSSAIDLETAGWVVLRRCAALPMLPASATVIRTWRS